MSTGLAAFDRTVEETNLWLKPLEERLGLSREQALAALRAVLHTLRDRLPQQTALNFADQLPLLLRGALVEAWRLSSTPTRQRSWDAFADSIADHLPPDFPVNGEVAGQAVLRVVSERMDAHEVNKVLAQLPRPVRDHWQQLCAVAERPANDLYPPD